MMLSRVRSLGAATFTLAAAVMLTPESAVAADPVPTTPAAWLQMGTPNHVITGGSTDSAHLYWSDIPQFQFQFVKASSGPGESLTSVIIQRPRGQYDQPFNLGIGTNLGNVWIQLRKAPVGGVADWFWAILHDTKVSVDEVRMSRGATVGTEILVLSFSKASVEHRTQTAQGYSSWAWVPMQFDIKDNVQLVPASGIAAAAATGGHAAQGR